MGFVSRWASFLFLKGPWMGFFSKWASFLFLTEGPWMGLFSRWSSFLFKALGWASFRDGLLFFLRPLDGLLFEMVFFSF